MGPSPPQGSRPPPGAGRTGLPLIVITGPTASGKSELAVALAEALGGEIVSADSMQVYRHLDIGTAKPEAGLRARVPHHLLDVVDPDEPFHAGRYLEEADRAVRDIASRGRVAVVCGGTALYIRVLLHGLAPAPPRDPGVRAALEARWDAGEGALLWAELREADPALAARIHPRDRTRILRGLEVWRVTGRPLSAFHREHGFRELRYRALLLGIRVPREELYRRIDERTVRMMQAGWVEEVRRVLSLGYSPSLPPLRAIGYREICEHLAGRTDLETAVRTIQQETRRFAKRQMTWFRRMGLEWLAPGEAAEAARRAKKFLQVNALALR